jgi:hypothetical protein
VIPPRIGLAFLALGASLATCRHDPSCAEHDPVSVELCGPRREWVGPWQSGDGVYLDIGPHGGFRYLDHRPHHFREVRGDIVGFEGQDMAIEATDGAELAIAQCT